ncbi:MAG: TonB-dependent receptor, partial [Saprospiraceae bacterium]|nr:TonB-dependent receptor [Saprospiraceae bacterium]
MISKKIIISLLFVLIVIGNLFSQQSISGKIYNEKTKQAIPNVEVVLKPLNKGSVTNKEGKFFFENIESGNYTIIVSHIGFVKQKKAITIEKNQNMILDFNLISEIFQLDPIEIRQSRMTKIPYIQNEVLRAELDQAGIKDIGEYMRTIPNVSGVRKGGSAVDPVVRGFKFSQLNVSLDNGIKIVGGCPNRMDPTVSHVASEDIEKIEVIKGPHVLRYGPAFGGVVNLITYKPTAFKTKKFELHAKAMKAYDSNANGNRERLFLTGGNNKVYFSLSGNRKNYGNYKDGNGDEVLSKFLKYNYTAKLGVKIKENQELLFSFDDSHTRDCYFPALPMDERIDDTRVMSINYSAKMVSKRVMGIMASAYNTDVWHVMDNKERGISDTAVTISKVQTYTRGASVGTMLKVWNNSKLRIGTGFMNVDKVGNRFRTYLQDPINGQLPKTNETLMDGNVTNAGLLLELTKDIGTFNIVAAARFDVNMAKSEDTIKIIYNGIHYFDEIESTHKNLSASLAINKPVSEKFSIGLAMGRGVRSPNLLERYVKLLPVGYDNFDYLGNPQIKPEANHQIDLSCKYNSEKIGYLE